MKQQTGKIQAEENIVLIGFMGCGKTTMGTKLSYRLRRTMEDTDKLIEKRQGKSVSDIFAQNGEGYFRDLETMLLEELTKSFHGKILSVGGGTPVRQKNRELLKKIGMVVYLRIQPETVYNRLKGDTTRPLLQTEDPMKRIIDLMGQRSALYEEAADLIIDVDEKESEQILRIICEAYQKRNKILL